MSEIDLNGLNPQEIFETLKGGDYEGEDLTLLTECCKIAVLCDIATALESISSSLKQR